MEPFLGRFVFGQICFAVKCVCCTCICCNANEKWSSFVDDLKEREMGLWEMWNILYSIVQCCQSSSHSQIALICRNVVLLAQCLKLSTTQTVIFLHHSSRIFLLTTTTTDLRFLHRNSWPTSRQHHNDDDDNNPNSHQEERCKLFLKKKSQTPNESFLFHVPTHRSLRYLSIKRKNADEDRQEMDGKCVGDGKRGSKEDYYYYLLLWILKSLMTAPAAAVASDVLIVLTRSPVVLSMRLSKLKTRWKKVKTCGFSSAKWIWPGILPTVSLLRKLVERKSVVIIMIWLMMLPVFDWSIIMIRRGGLLRWFAIT